MFLVAPTAAEAGLRMHAEQRVSERVTFHVFVCNVFSIVYIYYSRPPPGVFFGLRVVGQNNAPLGCVVLERIWHCEA